MFIICPLSGFSHKYDLRFVEVFYMNFIIIMRWYAFCLNFHGRWIFLTTSLQIPPVSLAMRVGFRDEWWEMNLAWKTMQNAFSRILYTLTPVNHPKYIAQIWKSWNHLRWTCLTTVLNMRESRKYARRC